MVRLGALCLATAAALAATIPARAAIGVDGPPSPPQLVLMWNRAEGQVGAARADTAALAAEPPDPNPLAEARRQLALSGAEYRFRDAARTEQVVVYAVAVDPAVEGAVTAHLPAEQAKPLQAAVAGLRALWRSAGIDDFSEIRLRHNRRFEASAPVPQLLSYYQAAGARYSIDWTYLASINFIESDFGRVLGPSSAGAMGPMQFMPGTWKDYGGGGDIMSPHDSIEAAARYLRAMGGPGNMDRAIFRYNNDANYVASVDGFADAFRSDPSWVDRMYYWSTAG